MTSRVLGVERCHASLYRRDLAVSMRAKDDERTMRTAPKIGSDLLVNKSAAHRRRGKRLSRGGGANPSLRV